MEQKKKGHILIVDDEPDLRELLKATLEEAGYSTAEAVNGKAAQAFLTLENCDAVISDIRMPEMDGVELLKLIKQTKNIPVILMTGFSDILETQTAYQMGASEFITKPFNNKELLASLELILNPKNTGGVPQTLDHEYCKVNIDEFTSGSELKFNIFVRLSEQKFIKIANKGQRLDKLRTESYKNKGITFLYMTKGDFTQYVGFNIKLKKIADEKDTVSPKQKLRLLKHTTDVILEHAHVVGVNNSSFKAAQDVVESTMELIMQDENLAEMVGILNTHNDYLYAHSIGVSMYSSLLAREAGWTSPATLFKISMGGLFHDIGKKELPRSLLDKPRKLYTAEEVKLYESHPARGRDILNEVSSVPTDVIHIVMYHHENLQGTGFPFHVRKENLHALAKIVAVANEFCDLTLKTANGPGISPDQALSRLISYHGDDLEPVFLLTLAKLFKITLSPEQQTYFKRTKVA
jgi:putative nucleotidyltransferase with HDIG domain